MILHRIDLERGRSEAMAPAIVKRITRFCRRLEERHIHFYDVPVMIDPKHAVTIQVGKRLVLIHPDGDLRQALKPILTAQGPRYDPKAMHAHDARWHADWLKRAAEDRKRGWLPSARAFLAIATDARTR